MSLPSEGRGLPTAFKLLWAGTVVNRVGFVVPAFLILYVVREHLGSVVDAAALVTAQGGGAVTASLAGGALADRLGPRRCIVTSQLLNALVALSLSVTRALLLFAPLTFLLGCLSAIHRPAGAAMVARIIDPPSRGRAYGMLYWATNIGASAAPVLAGFALTTLPRAIFFVNAATALAYAVTASRLPADVRAAYAPSSRLGYAQRMSRPFRTWPMAPFLLLSFALTLVYMQRQAALPLDMAANGLAPSAIGAALAVNGLLVVVLQPIASRLTSRLTLLRTFLIASVLIGAGFGVNAIVHSFAGFTAAICVWTCGEMALAPAVGAYIAAHAPAAEQGSFQGSYLFIWNLGLAVGAPVGAWLLRDAGSAVFWPGACVVGLAVAVGHLTLGRRHPYDDQTALKAGHGTVPRTNQAPTRT